MGQHDTSVEEDQTDADGRRARGEFVRGVSGFRHAIGDADFAPEPGRYHLHVALNCPWSHRAVLARGVLGLEDSVTMDVAFPNRTGEDDPAGPGLWEFAPDRFASLTGAPLAECTRETATGAGHRLLRQVYEAEGSGEGSVPVLYDRRTRRIVSNESAEIVRMLDTQAGPLGSTRPDGARPRLYPPGERRAEIDRLNSLIYHAINNGAYKAGFSSDQAVYAAAFERYFEALQTLEDLLASHDRPFLTGDAFTEADLRLFPTLYRHDPVYYVRMKLNGARILDFPHLWRWLCRVHALPGMRWDAVLTHCRQGYFGRSWNGVVPLGPFMPRPYPDAYGYPELARAPSIPRST